MKYVVYFLIAIGATTAGSLTGMGGGVIIKPLMDVMHDFDVRTIGLIASLTVLVMSTVSILRQMSMRTSIPFRTAVPLGLGSVAGGLIGDRLLEGIIEAVGEEARVTVVQNAVLGVLILAVYAYMKNKDRITGHRLEGVVVAACAGAFLGACSSFLGIGGGPINVALIIYLFSYDTKTATVCSLITIFFAQLSKIGSVMFTTGLAGYDLSVAPFMIAGAVAGGLIGSALSKRFSQQTVERAFNGVQLLVLAIAVYNIITNVMS